MAKDYYDSPAHRGIDYFANPNGGSGASPANVPVFAPCNLGISEAQFHYSWGNYIKAHMQDGPLAGKYILMAHFSSLEVAAGQNVAKGTQIGIQGATGYAFGNHVHTELWNTASDTPDQVVANKANLSSLTGIPYPGYGSNYYDNIYTPGQQQVPDDVWKIAYDEYTAADNRVKAAQGRINQANNIDIPGNKKEYEVQRALQQAAEARVQGLEPLADNLATRTKASIEKVYEEINYIFS